jgi:hypothetical protein
MLTLIFSEGVFTANREITESSFNNPNSNSVIKIICNPASTLHEAELMNMACNYINSCVDLHVMTNHVTNGLSLSNDSEIRRVKELMFQIYW